ncbi:recombinase family protein [Leucobacter komagatae]|uniref:Resolvase/invertase-type recombinase catalytic domain-containing protein n=1 Tax=Leucobacter komagatae TaxID=55969 RepID=A0A0D0HV93_9MICO|nr:recombinase family protein [Leucobacter komagatae]KIP51481.1 hypothetical protein SD72_15105 [Leucobacter komagatae]
MDGQVVAYLRVSSTDQNPDRQEQTVGAVSKMFVDEASGSSTNRPQLQEMLAYVREGDTVRVASIDRLARSTRDLNNLIAQLNELGVAVEFVKESLSFKPGTGTSSMDALMLGLLGAIAQFERALIRERQAEGIRAAKKRGVYERAPKLTPDDVESAKELQKQGIPKTVIAKRFSVSRTTLYQALKGAGSYA